MRIYFDSMTLPKKAAKRVKKYFSPEEPHLSEPMKLSQAQALTARMLGYRNWYELDKMTASQTHPPSLVDEKAPEDVVKRRITYQAQILATVSPLTMNLQIQTALILRVSAKNPTSPHLPNDPYRNNTLAIPDPHGDDAEWRFWPSLRSHEISLSLYSLLDAFWTYQTISFGEYKGRLDVIINEQPENIVPYQYILEVMEESKDWDLAAPYVAGLADAMERTVPQDYMRSKSPKLNWYVTGNRCFIRAVYYLAVGLYATGEHLKAKHWFLVLKHCSDMEMGNEMYYLLDLERKTPMGDVHLLCDEILSDRYFCEVVV